VKIKNKNLKIQFTPWAQLFEPEQLFKVRAFCTLGTASYGISLRFLAWDL